MYHLIAQRITSMIFYFSNSDMKNKIKEVFNITPMLLQNFIYVGRWLSFHLPPLTLPGNAGEGVIELFDKFLDFTLPKTSLRIQNNFTIGLGSKVVVGVTKPVWD